MSTTSQKGQASSSPDGEFFLPQRDRNSSSSSQNTRLVCLRFEILQFIVFSSLRLTLRFWLLYSAFAFECSRLKEKKVVRCTPCPDFVCVVSARLRSKLDFTISESDFCDKRGFSDRTCQYK